MSPRKSYSFTLNNYTEEEYNELKRVLGIEAAYCIVGREVGEAGTHHLQGYVTFKKSYRFSTIKERFLLRAHIEVSRGSPEQNRRYCSKDGDFYELGELPSTGSSTREELATSFVSAMDSGRRGMVEWAGSYPGTYYFSGHNLLRNYLAIKPPIERADISATWIYGPPGTGKSRAAHEQSPEAYIKEPRTKWWSGYLLETEVIIDDFGPNGIDINHLLRWLDRYKCFVETKGGMVPLYATKFIITSNFHPRELFKSVMYRFSGNTSHCTDDDHPQLPALMRRIQLINMN